MNESKHTPEPWKWDGNDLWHFGDDYERSDGSVADPHRYTGIVRDKRLDKSPILAANADRIVACVNALAGFDPTAARAVLEACVACRGAMANVDAERAADTRAIGSRWDDKLGAKSRLVIATLKLHDVISTLIPNTTKTEPTP